MKKYILISVVLAIAALFGMPYLVGVAAQKETTAVVVNLNEKINGHGHFEVVSYKRTYRETESSFRLYLPDFFESEIDITYSCKGQHGIISYAYDCLVDSYGSVQELIDEHFEGKELIALDGKIVLLGTLKQRFVIDAFNKSTDEQTVNFEGGEIKIETTRDLKSLKIGGGIGSFFIDYQGDKTSFKSFDIDGYFYDAGDTLDFGELEISASDFNNITKEQGELAIANVQLTSSLNERGETVEFNFYLKANDLISIDEDKNGDEDKNERDVESLDVSFKVKKINRKALIKLNKLIKTISSAGDDPEERSVGAMLALLPTVESFLTQGFGFSLNVDATEKPDRLLTSVDFELNDELSFIELSAVIYAPETILDKINLTSETILPDSFIDLDTDFEKYIAESTFYERVGNGYKNKFSLKNGNITINGKEKSVEQFISKVMEQATQ